MSDLEKVRSLVAENFDEAVRLGREIWEYAELSYEEVRSAAALTAALEKEGFTIKTGVADMPTCFTATFTNGEGGPVIGLLGEYDALDALSQAPACPEKTPLVPGAPGHGCGHNLLGAGCYSAAVALKEYLVRENRAGTVIYFGCPAEEGAGSKQFMARAGCFDGVDFCISWHPGTVNQVTDTGAIAIMGANFAFDGIASHAGGAPHLGRSALDAVELMNVGVNYLREHMIDSARIHYAYTDAGGTAPNVVQAHAVIKYEVRAPKVAQMMELFERVARVAKGAAMMTDTTLNYQVSMAFSDYTPNKALAAVMDRALQDVGAPAWTEEDYALAAKFLNTYNETTMVEIRRSLAETFPDADIDALVKKPLHSGVIPFNKNETRYRAGSTDVGDVGYAVPTVTLTTATACLGNVGHSWQNTAFAASEIGNKGMRAAAEAMVLTCVRLLDDPDTVAAAKAELLLKNGGAYECPLPPEATPPIGRY